MSDYDYLEDAYGIECLNLAKQCKSNIGFGAILVKDKIIIGRGRNRRATDEDRKRLHYVDYAIHAEQDCILNALDNNKDVSNSVVYVLGIVLKGKNKGKLTIKNEKVFVCKKCPHTLIQFNIPVCIPYINGWYKLSPQDAKDIGYNIMKIPGYWNSFIYN